jgi:hypothetical protein
MHNQGRQNCSGSVESGGIPMFKGQASFVAHVTAQHITFPKVVAKSPWTNVETIEIESIHEHAEEITGTVHVTGVASEALGIVVATEAIEDALNRLVFDHGVSIGPARITSSQFEPVARATGPGLHLHLGTGYLHISGGDIRVTRGLTPAAIQGTLEAAAPAGERHYWLYRSARASMTQVEEFLHLYSMLLQLVGERQSAVDAFILHVESSVPTSVSPRDGRTVETVYTRLRNEVGHRRPGTTMQGTRAEMAAHIDGLRRVVRAAVAASP